MQRSNIEANRALSSLMTSLKAQQMAMQIVNDNIMLQAMNAQKLAEGGQPHGYPAESGSLATKSFELLGKKLQASGNDLSQIVTALEGIERDLTLARRASESAFDGLARRGRYFEDAYFEVAYGEKQCPTTH